MSKKVSKVSAFKIFYDEFVYKENSNVSYALIDRNIDNIKNMTLEIRKTSKLDLNLYMTKLNRINKRIREQLNEMYNLNESLFEYCFLLYKSCMEVCNDKVSDMPFLISCAFYEDYRLDNKTALELESNPCVVPKYTSLEKKKIRENAKGLTKFEYFIKLINESERNYKSFNDKIKKVLILKPRSSESHNDFITRVENNLVDIEDLFEKVMKKAKINDDYERISDLMEIVFRKKFIDWDKELKNIIIEYFDGVYQKLRNSNEIRGYFNLINDISFETYMEVTNELVREKENYMKLYENGKFQSVDFFDDSYVSKFKENLINCFFDERYSKKIRYNPEVDECVYRAIELYDLAADLGNQIFEKIMFDSSHSVDLKRNNDVRTAIITKMYELYNPFYLLTIYEKTKNSFEVILKSQSPKFIKEYNEKLSAKKIEFGYHGPIPTMKSIGVKVIERRKDFILEHCITELKSFDTLGNYDTRNYDLNVVARDIEINDMINLYELIKYKISNFDYSSLNFYKIDMSDEQAKEDALIVAQEFVVKDIFGKLKIKTVSLEDLNNRYKDICNSYLNEECRFVKSYNFSFGEVELEKFIGIKDMFVKSSKWHEFISENKIKSEL